MVIGIDGSRAFGKERTGTENYAYHLITQMLGLPEAKNHVFVLYVRPNIKFPSSLLRPNVKVVSISHRYLWTQFWLAMYTWGKVGGLPGEKNGKIPRIEVLWVPAHTLPVLRRPGLKTVVTIHGLEYEWLPQYANGLQRWYLPLSTKYAAKAATRLIAVSNFTKRQLVERLHTVSKKIKVIHEGVQWCKTSIKSKQKFPVIWKRFGLNPQKYWLFVGTLQPRKNLPFIVAVFGEWCRRYPRETKAMKLVLAGSPGWKVEEITKTICEHGVQEKVILVGRVGEQELPGLYQGAIGYVQPSITEGFGLPILEAMAWGVPVVTSDGGALPEVAGKAALVLPVGQLGRWISGLRRVTASATLRAKLRRAGWERVNKLSWKIAAQKTLKVLTESIN